MNEELWRVQLSTGEIRMMTLEALDEAFNEGLIDARVPVLPPGTSAWTTLAEAAGLDECPTEQTPSLSPFAIAAIADSDTLANPESELEVGRGLSDLPESFEELAPRRRGLVGGVVVAALAIAAGVAVFAGKAAESMPVTSDIKAAAVQAPPPAAVEKLPAQAATTTAQAAPPAPPPVFEPAKEVKPEPAKEVAQEPAKEGKPELSDWQKRMLLDADKAREDKARAKKQEQAEKAPQPRAPKKEKVSNGLLNGGDRFDPLNGAL